MIIDAKHMSVICKAHKLLSPLKGVYFMIVTKIRVNIHAVSSARTLNFIVAFYFEV